MQLNAMTIISYQTYRRLSKKSSQFCSWQKRNFSQCQIRQNKGRKLKIDPQLDFCFMVVVWNLFLTCCVDWFSIIAKGVSFNITQYTASLRDFVFVWCSWTSTLSIILLFSFNLHNVNLNNLLFFSLSKILWIIMCCLLFHCCSISKCSMYQ